VHCLDVDLDADGVDYNGEGYARQEPVGLGLAIVVSRSLQAINSAEVGSSSMPDSKDNPPPEYLEVEEFPLLTSLVYDRVLVHELIVDILVNHISE